MIMFKRRSIRSAAAPASGPRTSAGSSEDSQTPPTAAPCAESPFPARASASEVRATRLSQSPRLDSDVAIHSRRNGLMDSTPSCPFDGDRKFTAPGYPHRPLHVGGRLANVRTCRPLSSRYEPVLAPAILAPAVFLDPAGFLAAGVFPAGVLADVRRRGAGGPAARRSASSSAARWGVSDSTASPWRSEALVSPSVTS